jgi:chitodextrinase
MTYIGEDFIFMSWSRPETDPTHHAYHCFPPANAPVHNYKVSIAPLAAESHQFRSEDGQPLVDGARVYETSQPTLKLQSLQPGTRYRVEVREQLMGLGGLLVDEFGVPSDPVVVETIEPMTVEPAQITENSAVLTWHRLHQDRTGAEGHSVIRSSAKISLFEVEVFRMDDHALNRVPHLLSLKQQYPASTQQCALPNLSPNSIYGITVRAQTAEGGGSYWGKWCSTIRFVTQKKLVMTVELVNEDNALLSWSRALPDWIINLGSDDASEGDESDLESAGGGAAVVPTTAPVVPPAALVDVRSPRDERVLSQLSTVIRGEYSVQLYRLTITGIGHSYSATLDISADKLAHCVGGLQPNMLYAVSIRALSNFDAWSVPSVKVSLCTLKPIELIVGRYGEHFAQLQWSRPPQDIAEHAPLLESVLMDLERDYERREKVLRLQLQKLQEKHELEGYAGEGEEADAAHQAAELDAELQALHEEQDETIAHLQADSVNMRKADVSGFHVRVFGGTGYPYILGSAHLLEKGRGQKRGGKKAGATSMAVSPARSVNSKSVRRSRGASQGPEVTMATDEIPMVRDEEEPQDDDLLLDVKINNRTADIVILGLEPTASYQFDIRGRNALNEWGPWSDRRTLTTLELLRLEQARIGEQYAHVFWHRLSAATRAKQDEEAAALVKWEEQMRAKGAPAANDAEAKAEVRAWRQRQKALQKFKDALQDGAGEITVGDGTHIAGYCLRIVHLPMDDRNPAAAATILPPPAPMGGASASTGDGRLTGRGQFIDEYFPAGSPASFTLTKLQSNSLYAAAACIDYGDGLWGAWTMPVKFMTQNLMQLNINYVSETFADLEWKRAPNRRLPRNEDGVITVNPLVLGGDNLYEISLQSVDSDGKRRDERREVRNATFFRVDNLRPDTRYELCVREKDNRGQWGLWSASKACFTLASMQVNIGDVGEYWFTLSWDRLAANAKRAAAGSVSAISSPRGNHLASAASVSLSPPGTVITDDVVLVDLPVTEMAYFLRVVELDDNGTPEDLARLQAEGADTPRSAGRLRGGSLAADTPADDDDFLQSDDRGPQLQPGSPLPPGAPPVEQNPEADQRYCFVRKFDYTTKSFKLEDLKPNRFYAVQVLCETTGSQLGNWSSDLAILTLRTITCGVALIDEESARIAWEREAPRQHPRLHGARVVVGQYKCAEYEVEAFGCTTDFHYSRRFQAADRECRIDQLAMAAAYGVRVRSTDTSGRVSQWSDALHFATLSRMRVLPDTLTENFAWVEWGREPQRQADYPALDPPLHVPADRSVSYHMRVHAVGDAVAMLDKQFQGTTARFQLHGLQPNTAYTVQVRACNPMGEWGQWSPERVIYTMKLIEAQIQAVGEEYIVVAWRRDAPDERNDMIRVEMPASTKTGDDDEDDGAAPAKAEIITRRQFPLLDAPDRDLLLYRSNRTKITRLRISVQMSGEGDSTTVDTVDNDADSNAKIFFPVTGLRPDSQYFVSIAACYDTDEDWGLYSEAVTTCTLNTLAMNVKHVGENYISSAWSRQPNSFDIQGLHMGRTEATLCYQFVVYDFTSVPSGTEHAANLPSLLVHDTKTRDKHQLLRNLSANRRYRLAVRRWYRPVQAVNADVPARQPGESPTAASKDIETELSANEAMPGHWSEPVYVLTLRKMVVTAEDIAEDFMRVQWERDPLAPALPTRQVLKVHTVVNSYHVKIDELDHSGNENTEVNTLHFEKHYPEDTTSFRVEQLVPDTAYRIAVRCCTDKTWGDWSTACVVVTLPKIHVTVTSIGEDYINVSWQRNIRTLTLPDGRQALSGNTNNLEKYQLEMFGLEVPYHLEKKFKGTRTSYRIKYLEAQTVYALVVRSCDNSNTWSMWSDRITVVTLKQLQVSFGKVGEQFAHVSWSRDAQSAEEYKAHGLVHVGDPTVKAYHLVLFPLDSSPTTAVLDKQFGGDAAHFRVTELNPANSYIAIVRACNNDAEGQWGLWSEEKVVTTLPLIQMQILSIGENYVAVKWSRDDTHDDDGQSHGMRVEPTMFRIGVTGERASIEKTFTIEEAVLEDDTPTYTVRSLAPDTSYVVSMHACYGDDEWGLWTVPVTFLTPNKLGIIVSNVAETRAEFTWGRGQQSPQHAHDPNILVWQPNVVRYQLVLRRLDRYREMQERRQRLQGGDTSAGDPDGAARSDPTDGAGADDDDEVRVMEREMDHRHSKYMQTFCVAENLQVNTDYHVQVRALDDRQEWGEWSDLVFDTPPMPPSRPTLKKQGNSLLVFTWDPPDATGQYLYLVEQSVMKDKKGQGKNAKETTSEGEWKPVDTYDEPVAKIRATGVLNKIRCRVKCCKVDRPVHLWSQFTQPVALASQQPPQPTPYLNVVSTSRTSAHCEWARSPSAPAEAQQGVASPTAPASRIQYKVLFAARDHAMTVATTTRALAYELTDLAPNTAYRVQVVVETDAGVASQGNPIQRFTTRAEGDKGGKGPVPATARPLTSEGRLPALTASTTRGVMTQSARDTSYTPKPPADPNQRGNRPHPPPLAAKGPQKPPGSKTVTGRRMSSSSRASLDGAARDDTPSQSQPQLPPVERRGPPPQSESHDMASYEVVGFAPSEDGEAHNNEQR